MSALVLSGVTVDRGGRLVLDRIDVTFAAGRLTAVIGPNGAGKSTLLEVGAGLLAPASGTITLGETVLATLSRRALARRRAYLPQRAGVEWPISVERVVALGFTPLLPTFGDLPEAMQPRIDQALQDYDLVHLRDRAATTLSGGELARVMLARAVAGDPELLIVDEPTAGLDPRHALDAARRLRARADAGCTVIMSAHELDLALQFADDIVAIKEGHIDWSGSAEQMTGDDLSRLYDVDIRLTRDDDGVAIRFRG